MSSIMDISSVYQQYAGSLRQVSSEQTTSKLGNVGEGSTDEELMEACKSFESYFVQKMIEEMKKTLDNEDEQGDYTKMFADMKNQQLAETITESGQVGLAQQLYNDMRRQQGIADR